MTPCEPGLVNAIAVGGIPLLVAVIVVFFVGVFLGLLLLVGGGASHDGLR